MQRFIDAGLYPAERLREHPKRNVLYASLGANEESVEPFVSETPIALLPGDGILLCSDGVWELIDATLGKLHAMSPNVAVWRDHLVAAVRRSHGTRSRQFQCLAGALHRLPWMPTKMTSARCRRCRYRSPDTFPFGLRHQETQGRTV